MLQTTLSLPRCKLECRRCRKQWIQGLLRVDRGHVVMKRGEQCVFVLDDTCYELDETVDVRAILRPLGYLDYPAPLCPTCGRGDAVSVVRSLLDSSDDVHEDVPCVELESSDFVKSGCGWRLSDETVYALGIEGKAASE